MLECFLIADSKHTETITLLIICRLSSQSTAPSIPIELDLKFTVESVPTHRTPKKTVFTSSTRPESDDVLTRQEDDEFKSILIYSLDLGLKTTTIKIKQHQNI